MRTTIAILITVFCSGCAMTPGLIPSMGGRTVIEREFHDSDSAYSESIKAPAGVDVSQLSRFSLRLTGNDGSEYEVGLDADSAADTTEQAKLLAQISKDSLDALRASLATLEALAPGISQLLAKPAPAPVVSVPIDLGLGDPR